MSRSSAFILGLAFIIGSIVVFFGGLKLGEEFLSKERSVIVKGLSQREVEADIIVLPIQFSKASNDLNALSIELESDSKKIYNFLLESGFSNDEITFMPNTINDKIGNSYNSDAQIAYRYDGSGGLTLYTDKIKLARDVMNNLSSLSKQGVIIQINNYEIEYLYTKLNDIKPLMIEEATNNAREVASKFAQDSNSSLGKIKKASQGQFSIQNRDKNTKHIKTIRVVSTIEYYLKD
ncbi:MULTISPECIES: SIMPL domain-containing protein [Helicobacter]|uniref:SIMPL domain-containing protein n=1 Tax=Helicobacter ibis TaxID=2962633 RepID=A0ABT4VGZ6_9HELI|nr:MULTISPECIES: SIMPL domain-containing protein [Helicobacter]MDA3967734.1 SIMPL domain-containing protein [Helicobacter sp. WB40]MDA3969453.1 SIMPL domain-containing protein [Helicobacter ibis]